MQSYLLSKKTCVELRNIAKEKGLTGYSQLKKEGLIDLLTTESSSLTEEDSSLVSNDLKKAITNPYRIASFDPAKVNLAMLVEEYEMPEQIKKFKRSFKKINVQALKSQYTTIFTQGRTIFAEKINVSTSKKTYLSPKVFTNIVEYLDKHADLWETCNVFVIEEQMAFGKQINTMALKIGQHLYTYFMLRYPQKNIVSIPAYYKTQVLGAGVMKKKADRKKWAVIKAEEVWMLRGDYNTLKQVALLNKKDDVSDCLLQSIAYYILTSVL